MLNNLPQMHLKLLQINQFKTAEVAGDLIGNKIDNKITQVSRNSTLNYSETIESESENIGLDIEMLKERHIYFEKRQKVIDDLGLI